MCSIWCGAGRGGRGGGRQLQHLGKTDLNITHPQFCIVPSAIVPRRSLSPPKTHMHTRTPPHTHMPPPCLTRTHAPPLTRDSSASCMLAEPELHRQSPARPPPPLPCIQAALRLNPSFTDAHNTLACALVQRGLIPQAMQVYMQALAINPNLVRPPYP